MPTGEPATKVGLHWAREAVRAAARVARRAAYYCLPPAVHAAARTPAQLLLPRAFHPTDAARLRRAVGRWFGRGPDAPSPFPPAEHAVSQYREYYALPERSAADVAAKLARLRELLTALRCDRVRLFREAARLERARGNDLTAAVYAVRCMRLSGSDRYADLGWVRSTLERHGHPAEGEAAGAMYGPESDRDAACERLLRAARERSRQPAPQGGDDYAVWDDRRGAVRPRVSVVTTVYNGAGELHRFLDALRLQTLHRRGELELVLVDSDSPADEYTAFRQAAADAGVPALFARTRRRETIQAAWNRGIQLARGTYLSLLGVDETVVPHGLERLTDTLDANPGTDWAHGSVLCTAVDADGAHAADLMTYDKTGYANDLVSLETCYLGPVGAAYRKALHDRAGWFDPTFRAAGDTEFKSRALPHLTVATLPDVLGVYLNYPDTRTTESAAAELEDCRAWYLHRTPSGVRLAYADRPTADLERQLVRCLGYRKSFTRHQSTDFTYAESVAAVLRERAPDSPVLAALGPGVAQVARAYRDLDCLPDTRPDRWEKAVTTAWAAVRQALAGHRRTGLAPPTLDYAFANDNINEQHHWLW